MLTLEKQNEWRERYRRQHPGWKPATERFAELVHCRMRPDSHLLDLGCGRGGLVEQLVEGGFPAGQVIGIDPDWLSLREHRLDIATVQGFSRCLPFAARSFDLIYSSWLLEHLTDPATDFGEIRRILRPTGAFVFLTPNRSHPLSALNRLLGRIGRLQGRLVSRLYGRAAEDVFPTYYRANSVVALHRLAQQSGLELALLEFVPDPSYLAFNAAAFRLMSWIEARLPEERRLHLVGVLTPAATAAPRA
jgi:ubiquinone/menaquinone biosynthesis C-methylase UbiE